MLEELYLEKPPTLPSIVDWIGYSITGYNSKLYNYVDSHNIYKTISMSRNPLGGKVLKVQKVC